eukprot:jgi/Mesen1/3735/ME000204S02996
MEISACSLAVENAIIWSKSPHLVTRLYQAHLNRLHVKHVSDPRIAFPRRGVSARARVQVAGSSEAVDSCPQAKLFLFGLGYTGVQIGKEFQRMGWQVAGTCRGEDKRQALEQQGFQAFCFNPHLEPNMNLKDPDLDLDLDPDLEPGEAPAGMMGSDGISELLSSAYVLSTVPPSLDSGLDPVLTCHAAELASAASEGYLQWIGYLSSTSVYGDHGGGWVDESTTANPSTPKARVRAAAEDAWLHLGSRIRVPTHVFRLGGIYGPGRSAVDTVARRGQLSALQQERQQRQFTSRCHVSDICQVVRASMARPHAGRVYNVVDDEPAPRGEVMAYARSLLQLQGASSGSSGAPEEAEAEPQVELQHAKEALEGLATRGGDEQAGGRRSSAGGRSGEKRVSNRRIAEELGVRLLFPTYREGLRAIVEQRPALATQRGNPHKLQSAPKKALQEKGRAKHKAPPGKQSMSQQRDTGTGFTQALWRGTQRPRKRAALIRERNKQELNIELRRRVRDSSELTSPAAGAPTRGLRTQGTRVEVVAHVLRPALLGTLHCHLDSPGRHLGYTPDGGRGRARTELPPQQLRPLPDTKARMEDSGKRASGKYKGVVVGGTFDHLHEGHKLLLRTAVGLLAADGRLIIGLTEGALLSGKHLYELIQPYSERKAAVLSFIDSVSSSGQGQGQGQGPVQTHIEPITQAVPQRGSTDPGLDCIVVSSETVSGARALNAARASNGVQPLELVVVDTVAAEEDTAEGKLSSTLMRRRALGTLLPRETRVDYRRLQRGPLSTGPYMIGLTGGIASGKSSVRQLALQMGAAVIDCDVLGHRSYEIGTPTYDAIVSAFGREIVRADGSVDRAALGARVFGNPAQLARLTAIVWPAVKRLVAEEREALAESGGADICVAEAAVMLEAGSQDGMDEVWVVFTPRDAARERLMARNGLSAEDANKRIQSQMSSAERVARADVALYNGGPLDDTRVQLEAAWKLLQDRVAPLRGAWQAAPSRHPLWARWVALLSRLGVASTNKSEGEGKGAGEGLAEKWWRVLEGRYGEGQRHYHSLAHVQALFRLYHEYAHFIQDPAAVQLAIFFHDAVYDPCCTVKGGNERASADLFDDFAAEASLPSTLAQEVRKYIEQTSDHLAAHGASGDLAWFLDLDMAVLGSPTDEYRAYADAIRKEYGHIDDAKFARGRRNFLQALLDAPQVFHTKPMQAMLAGKLRNNVLAELAQL